MFPEHASDPNSDLFIYNQNEVKYKLLKYWNDNNLKLDNPQGFEFIIRVWRLLIVKVKQKRKRRRLTLKTKIIF